MEPKTGKRIVSKREYVKVLGVKLSLALLCLVWLLLGTIGITISLFGFLGMEFIARIAFFFISIGIYVAAGICLRVSYVVVQVGVPLQSAQ